jgi:hypothetical protein
LTPSRRRRFDHSALQVIVKLEPSQALQVTTQSASQAMMSMRLSPTLSSPMRTCQPISDVPVGCRVASKLKQKISMPLHLNLTSSVPISGSAGWIVSFVDADKLKLDLLHRAGTVPCGRTWPPGWIWVSWEFSLSAHEIPPTAANTRRYMMLQSVVLAVRSRSSPLPQRVCQLGHDGYSEKSLLLKKQVGSWVEILI